MSTVWHEQDFADKERQQRLWEQDNVTPNLIGILTWFVLGLWVAYWVVQLFRLVDRLIVWLLK